MKIELEVNNGFYLDTLEEMAATIKKEPADVVSRMVSEAIREYRRKVDGMKYEAVCKLCGEVCE